MAVLHRFYCTIRIYHECEIGIEKSVPRITVLHHQACRLMTECDDEVRICLSHTNNSFSGSPLYIAVSYMVKAPYIAHLSILTSVGYNKKETNLKNCSQRNKVIIILYLHKVQNDLRNNLKTPKKMSHKYYKDAD